ncbi:MAG TPA: pyridoxal 5'-phosphate synthase glutaminase subunit PdxT [Candidatus Bathyarchaeia archaeon]|nr:pyridoxal 5'-phosphate synthase glutaminase subunit PdxT [Candidatus Bathyarchaeia archaeon]
MPDAGAGDDLKPLNIGVLGVQGDIEEHEAALKLAYRNLGLDGKVTWLKTSPQAENVQGLVVPGGESTAIGRLAEDNAVLQTLRGRIEKGLPTLGTCAGIIMLAEEVHDRTMDETNQHLLGGLDVTVERNAFGRQRESFEANLSIPVLGSNPFRGVFIRAPIVKQVSPKVEVLSKLEDRIVAIKQGNIVGTSFHPELSRDNRLHEYFVRTVTPNPILT